MNFLNTWAGVVGMYAFAAALFAYSFWSHAAREKAIDQGGGLSVTRLGRGMIMAGLIIGGSGPLFRGVATGGPFGGYSRCYSFGFSDRVICRGTNGSKMGRGPTGESGPFTPCCKVVDVTVGNSWDNGCLASILTPLPKRI